MAPADHNGYALLPQDDWILSAGGPVKPEPVQQARSFSKESVGSFVEAALEDTSKAEAGADWGGEDGSKHNRYEHGVRFDSSTEPWVIHPYHPVVQKWYNSLMCFLVADIVYLPLETAFGRYMPQHVIFLIDFLCTLVFGADMVLQFFLQIQSSTGDFWVFNHSAIIRSYLRGNFAVDLVSVLPFSELHLLFSSAKTLRFTATSGVLHMLRFLKLLRMMRLRRILHRHMYNVNLTYLQRSVIFCSCSVLVSIHVFSCVWATLGNYQSGAHSWLTEHRDDERMRLVDTGYEMPVADMQASEDTLAVYIMSTYFAIYTLTGIGYGDIVPTSVLEFFVVIAIMLIGSMIWATIIGEIVSVMRHNGAGDELYQRLADEVVSMGTEFNLDPDLQYRIQTYLNQSKMIYHSNFVREKVLSCMTSDLAVQVTQVLHQEWFNGIWWLKSVNQNQFMVQLTLAFDPMLYAPKEMITSTDRLFVIQRGLVIHGRQLLGKDKCFGVDMLLTTDELRTNVITIAFSYLHVLFLTREALQATLEAFPREQQLVKRAYRVLVIMRGMVKKAREVKRERAREARGQGVPTPKEQTKFLGSMTSSDDLHARTILPSQALSTRATDTQVRDTIAEASRRLEALEGDMNRRMASTDEKLHEALLIAKELVKKKQGPRFSLLGAGSLAVPERI